MKNFIITALIIFLVGTSVYTCYEISRLSNRIQKIENKLGGPGKIACTEKKTVEKVRRSVVRVVGGESEGSGFVIQKGGLILTNFHVIDSEPNPKVIFPDNTFETAQIIMADKDTDLAIIKVKRNLHSPNDQLATSHQGVDIPAFTNSEAHVTALSCCPIRARSGEPVPARNPRDRSL